jgi:hypothetical protein
VKQIFLHGPPASGQYTIARALLRRRVTNPSRAEMRKIHTVEGLDEYMEAWNVVALERPNTVIVGTEGRSPEECAEEIAKAVL